MVNLELDIILQGKNACFLTIIVSSRWAKASSADCLEDWRDHILNACAAAISSYDSEGDLFSDGRATLGLFLLFSSKLSPLSHCLLSLSLVYFSCESLLIFLYCSTHKDLPRKRLMGLLSSWGMLSEHPRFIMGEPWSAVLEILHLCLQTRV